MTLLFASKSSRRLAFVHVLYFSLVIGALWLSAQELKIAAPGESPYAVYLTLDRDVHHAMVVNFMMAGEDRPDVRAVYGRADTGSILDETVTAEPVCIKALHPPRWVFHVPLTDLEPGAAYQFKLTWGQGQESLPMQFRTVPNKGPLRFIEGGDAYASNSFTQLLRTAAAYDPMFAVIGGDFCHGNGELKNVRQWEEWLTHWQRHAVTPDGYQIPIVATLGNHETNEDVSQRYPEERAPFYLALFGHQDESVYFERRFDQGLALYMLDSDHLLPHEVQAPWLEAAMSAAEHVPVKMAVYHKPAFPAVRDFTGGGATNGQAHWVPVFDRHGLTAAFEHHGHILKRTHLLRGGQPSDAGTLYLGEGCLGDEARETAGKPTKPYLHHAATQPHCWLVDVDGKHSRYRALTPEGEIADEVRLVSGPAGAVHDAGNAQVAQR